MDQFSNQPLQQYNQPLQQYQQPPPPPQNGGNVALQNLSNQLSSSALHNAMGVSPYGNQAMANARAQGQNANVASNANPNGNNNSAAMHSYPQPQQQSYPPPQQSYPQPQQQSYPPPQQQSYQSQTQPLYRSQSGLHRGSGNRRVRGSGGRGVGVPRGARRGGFGRGRGLPRSSSRTSVPRLGAGKKRAKTKLMDLETAVLPMSGLPTLSLEGVHHLVYETPYGKNQMMPEPSQFFPVLWDNLDKICRTTLREDAYASLNLREDFDIVVLKKKSASTYPLKTKPFPKQSSHTIEEVAIYEKANMKEATKWYHRTTEGNGMVVVSPKFDLQKWVKDEFKITVAKLEQLGFYEHGSPPLTFLSSRPSEIFPGGGGDNMAELGLGNGGNDNGGNDNGEDVEDEMGGNDGMDEDNNNNDGNDAMNDDNI